MFDRDVTETWKRAGAGGPPLAREAIERLLRPSRRRASRTLAVLAWMHAGLLVLALGLALASLALYRGNPTMLAVEGCLALAAAALAANSARLAVRAGRTDRADLPLLETVERQLALYERAFEPWLVLASMTPWILSMAINTRIDGADGTYRIHQPLEFVLVSATMLVLTYVGTRVALASTVYELRAVLHDLRAEALEETPKVAAARRRTRVRMALLLALLTLSVLAGLWLWWRLG